MLQLLQISLGSLEENFLNPNYDLDVLNQE